MSNKKEDILVELHVPEEKENLEELQKRVQSFYGSVLRNRLEGMEFTYEEKMEFLRRMKEIEKRKKE